MIEAVERFFADIDRHGPDLLPGKYSGTIRFDLALDHVDEHYLLEIDRGQVRVLREDRETDCVVRVQQDHFAAVVANRYGLYAAIWRNLITVEGDLALMAPLRELMSTDLRPDRLAWSHPEG